MSDKIVVPEDLRGDYAELQYCKREHKNGAVFTYYMDCYISAIERIAKLEQKNATLREALQCEEAEHTREVLRHGVTKFELSAAQSA